VTSAGQTKKVGDIEVIAVSDGLLETSLDVLVGLDRAELERLAGRSSGEPIHLPVNSFLVRLADRLALIDTGAGVTRGPSLGRLPANLRALGVAPERISHVLLTHFHSDHSNGLIEAGGHAVFPNAELIVHEKDASFWFAAPTPTDSDRIRRTRDEAKRAAAPYRDRMRTVTNGEVLPGISAVLQAGHTPGHTGWLIQSKGDRLLVWGDIVHLASVQVPRPDAALAFDVDQAAACASRRRVFERVVAERLCVAGAHLDFPGFGRLARDGSGYRYAPELH
jgi:glyoxylase-like metal-dependent hydrolase (beta-lactamase superfamily II)